MYEFQYNYVKRKYADDKLTLCYMDTDSLIYDIETDDFYKDKLMTLRIDLIRVAIMITDHYPLVRIR